MLTAMLAEGLARRDIRPGQVMREVTDLVDEYKVPPSPVYILFFCKQNHACIEHIYTLVHNLSL
jgi:hypothetical protein